MSIRNVLHPSSLRWLSSENTTLTIVQRILSKSFFSLSNSCILRVSFCYRNTIRKAVKYLHAAQYPNGGWHGSWGICFSYATMFALESLALVGETYATSARVRKACQFLLSHQKEDGGWGESYEVRDASSRSMKFIAHGRFRLDRHVQKKSG